jgi:translocator protein
MHMTELWLAGFWALILLGGGGLLTTIGSWYRNLRKPRLQPPDWLFGPAWTVILGAAAWAGVLAWRAAPDDAARTAIIILFAVNGLCHFLWSPIFFTWKRPDFALIEVVFLWVSVAALIYGLAAFSKTASLLCVPYLLWVSFAAWLNWAIVRLNGPFASPVEMR